jgi:hypothetical protein
MSKLEAQSRAGESGEIISYNRIIREYSWIKGQLDTVCSQLQEEGLWVDKTAIRFDTKNLTAKITCYPLFNPSAIEDAQVTGRRGIAIPSRRDKDTYDKTRKIVQTFTFKAPKTSLPYPADNGHVVYSTSGPSAAPTAPTYRPEEDERLATQAELPLGELADRVRDMVAEAMTSSEPVDWFGFMAKVHKKLLPYGVEVKPSSNGNLPRTFFLVDHANQTVRRLPELDDLFARYQKDNGQGTPKINIPSGNSAGPQPEQPTTTLFSGGPQMIPGPLEEPFVSAPDQPELPKEPKEEPEMTLLAEEVEEIVKDLADLIDATDEEENRFPEDGELERKLTEIFRKRGFGLEIISGRNGSRYELTKHGRPVKLPPELAAAMPQIEEDTFGEKSPNKLMVSLVLLSLLVILLTLTNRGDSRNSTRGTTLAPTDFAGYMMQAQPGTAPRTSSPAITVPPASQPQGGGSDNEPMPTGNIDQPLHPTQSNPRTIEELMGEVVATLNSPQGSSVKNALALRELLSFIHQANRIATMVPLNPDEPIQVPGTSSSYTGTNLGKLSGLILGEFTNPKPVGFQVPPDGAHGPGGRGPKKAS